MAKFRLAGSDVLGHAVQPSPVMLRAAVPAENHRPSSENVTEDYSIHLTMASLASYMYN